jgi:hypothetical protein
MEHATSLASEDLLSSFFKVGSMANLGLPRLGSDTEVSPRAPANASHKIPAAPQPTLTPGPSRPLPPPQLQELLKKVPSSSALAPAPGEAGAPTPSRPAPALAGPLPRVTSLDFIRAYRDCPAPNDTILGPEDSGVATPDACRTAAAAAGEHGAPFGAAPLPALPAPHPAFRPALFAGPLGGVAFPANVDPHAMLAAALAHSAHAGPHPMLPYLAAMAAAGATVPLGPTSAPDSAANGASDAPKSGASSGGGAPGGGAPGGGDDKARVRRERRMLSNRESARRSRKRKQEHVAVLEAELAVVAQRGESVGQRCARLEEELRRAQAAADALRAENAALRARAGGAKAGAGDGAGSGAQEVLN